MSYFWSKDINYYNNLQIICEKCFFSFKGKNEFFGRDEFYNSVIVKSDENLIGKLEEISIIDGNQNTLFGVRKDHDKKEFAA